MANSDGAIGSSEVDNGAVVCDSYGKTLLVMEKF